MDLKQLGTFLHVVELGSLSRAAERLRVAQPALSRQIRLLEGELGVALFVRHGRGMIPTAAGEILRIRAEEILRGVEAAKADVAAEADTVSGRVTFGMPPTVGQVLGMRLIERFRARHPQVALRIVLGFSASLLEWLHDGDLDLAVVYGTSPTASVRYTPLIEETLCLISREPGPRRVSLAEATARQLALPGPRQSLRRLVESEARARGLALDVPIEADDLQMLKELVAKGLGATILPLAAVHAEVAAGRLHAAEIVDPRLARRLVIAEPLGRVSANAVRRFVSALQEEVAEMVAAGHWEGC